MEKITKYFKHDYENDTTIEYVSTGAYSMLNCSYTSEDPDYGTDTLHYNATPAISMAQMAYEMVGELSHYLDKKDSGRRREITDAERRVYGDYSNSTLYAVEHALKAIADEYRPRQWFGHLEDVCREIAKRIIKDGNKKFSFCEASQDDWERYSPEEYDDSIGSEWFGIKRLDPIFDNNDEEFIVAIGYYGGGDVKTAYVYTCDFTIDECILSLGRQMCQIIESLTGSGPQDIIFAAEEKEGK